jgi:putative transcriptional regulator
MKDEDFDALLASVAEARTFMQERAVPGLLVHHFPAMDIAAIRKKTSATQDGFARQPEGPARVLLAMLARDPGIVARELS